MRLYDQSLILEDLLHGDTIYPIGSRVLEVACGVGAQARILASKSPRAEIDSVDISMYSLREAQSMVEKEGLTNVTFQQADILGLPFSAESFDHIFVCFVLEHLPRPLDVLAELKRVLRRGGTITVIEGDHGSCFWHPQTAEALRVWRCLIEAQAGLGHNSLIGRQLCMLMNRTGLYPRYILPRWIYVDACNPDQMKAVLGKIMVPMIESAKDQSIAMGLIDEPTWRRGIDDICHLPGLSESAFFYTWFKAVAVK
jgi:SAM-dependent methyltransferase